MTAESFPDHTSRFERAWRRNFGDSPPLGHVLRHDYWKRWTRFHALPGSKRYAENAVERAIVLERANTLATECFGKRKEIWISTAHYLSTARHRREIVEATDLVNRFGMTKWMTWFDPNEEPEDRVETTFFIARIEWSPSSLDELLWEIAEDRDSALLFSEDDETVFAPYDGGFDIICLRPKKLGELETIYRSWMSDRADKL